jgi:hypothetical protein
MKTNPLPLLPCPVRATNHSRHLPALALLVALLPGWQIAEAATVAAGADSKPAGSSAAITQPEKNGLVKGSIRTSKTSLDVQIDYSFDTPVAGSTTEVRLKVTGVEPGRPLAIDVAPGTGLRTVRGMSGGGAVMQSAQSADHTMLVAPDGDGLHYIHVFLRAGNMTEALAIAVPVGKNPAPAKAVEPRTLPDGRRIKSIPSQP